LKQKVDADIVINRDIDIFDSSGGYKRINAVVSEDRAIFCSICNWTPSLKDLGLPVENMPKFSSKRKIYSKIRIPRSLFLRRSNDNYQLPIYNLQIGTLKI